MFENRKTEFIKIATFECGENSDGQTVEVWEDYMPYVCFYTLKVQEGPDSVGTVRPAYEVRTGSSQKEIAMRIADSIAKGMIGFYPAPKEIDHETA